MQIPHMFYMILTMSAMGSILTLIIIFIKKVFKNNLTANWHYFIWLILIIRLIILNAPESHFSVFNLFTPDVNQTEYAPVVQSATVEKINLENKEDFKYGFKVVSYIWFIGAISLLLYTLIVNVKFYFKLKNRPKCKDAEVLNLLEESKATLRIHSDVSVIYDNTIKTPTLYKLIKPKLIISLEIMSKLSSDEKRYVFLHELTHLKHKDILINWISTCLCYLHWFNPVIWYAFRRMQHDCELACDANVLSHIKPPEHKKYGKTIIKLLEIFSKTYFIPGSIGIFGDKAKVKERIVMISNFKKTSYKQSIVAILIIASVVFVGLTNSKTREKVILNESELNRERASISFSENEASNSSKLRFQTLEYNDE